ncbi:CASP C terminal-domain-containing protein [Chytridium lagenaria]|nr:CASP C terminal-domain-containing protein [Chytridium lagenaria]
MFAEANDGLNVGLCRPSSMEDGLAAALKAWKDVDLSKLQKDLDAQGLEIVENQKEGLQSRKKLAEQTKAPDPAPLIAAAADHAKHASETSTLQHENKRLKEELAEAEKELAAIRNSEGSVAVLKSRLGKYEARLEEMVAEKVGAKEAEMKQVLDEKIRVYKETEYSLQRQLNQAKDQLVSLQTTHNNTQARLVDHSRQYDEEVAVKLAELDIVAADLERATQKVSVLERDNDQLRKELSSFRGDAASGVWQDPSLLSRKVKAQDVEISKLLTEMENLRQQLTEKEGYTTRRITELEREAANLEAAQMKEQAARYEDYEQVKKELHVMKLIQFSSKGTEAFDLDADGLENSGDPDIDYSLEKLLMEKISGSKQKSQITSDLTKRNEELEEARAKSESQAHLISKLEEDMYKLNSLIAGGGFVNQNIDDPILSITTPSPANALGLRSQDVTGSSSLVSPPSLTTPNSQSPLGPATIGQPAAESSTTIVPILESRSLHQSIVDLKMNMEKLQSDNLKLYEKLRYAESFQPGTAASASESYRRSDLDGDDGKKDAYLIQMDSKASRRPGPRTPLPTTTHDIRSDDVTTRYRSIYDAGLDPFQRFNKQEELRRVKDMNPAERGLLTFTRLLAGNRYTSQWEECRHDMDDARLPGELILKVLEHITSLNTVRSIQILCRHTFHLVHSNDIAVFKHLVAAARTTLAVAHYLQTHPQSGTGEILALALADVRPRLTRVVALDVLSYGCCDRGTGGDGGFKAYEKSGGGGGLWGFLRGCCGGTLQLWFTGEDDQLEVDLKKRQKRGLDG